MSMAIEFDIPASAELSTNSAMPTRKKRLRP